MKNLHRSLKKHILQKQFHMGHVLLVFFVQILVLSFILSKYPSSVHSDTTFTVNSTIDSHDVNPGDGICADTDGNCTLRAAVEEGVALSGTETINVPSGLYMISLGDIQINNSMTIVGQGATTTLIDGDGAYRGLVTAGGTIHISNLGIQHGYNAQGGGGILNTANTTLTNVILSGNTTDGYGAGLWSYDNILTLENVLVKDNVATGTYPFGGGIYISVFSQLFATNVTISGNSAVTTSSNAWGGGLAVSTFDDTVTTATLTNVTFLENSASANTRYGNELYVNQYVTVKLKNTLIANLNGNSCYNDGTITSLGYNLSSDTSCSAYLNQEGDQNNIDPLIDSLADNGGQTETAALQVGSPAIDAGTNAGCPATDQRGISRPYNLICDIGAFEYYVAPTSTPTPTGTPAPTSTPGPTATPTPAPPSCNSIPPSTVPDLYQIDVTQNTAKLLFAPAGKPYTYYYVGYGYNNGEENFGASFDIQDSDGSITYTINDLQPNTPYYFRVRAGNGCTPGEWSSWLGARTPLSGSYSFNKFNQQYVGIPFYTEPSPTETVEEAAVQLDENIQSTPTPTTVPTISSTPIIQSPTTKPTQFIRQATSTPKPTLPPFNNPSSSAPKQSEGFFSNILSFFTSLFSF